MRLTVKAKALKAAAILDPSAFLNVRIPSNEPRVALTIQFPTGTMTAAVNAKALRKVVAAVSGFPPLWSVRHPLPEPSRGVRGPRDHVFISRLTSLRKRKSVCSAMSFCGLDLTKPASCRRSA